MPVDGSIASQWYFKRVADASDARGGPYTWDQMTGFAASGLFTPDDLVWHATLPGWVPARDVAGLFVGAGDALPTAASAAQPQAVPLGVVQQAPVAQPMPSPTRSPRRSRVGLVVGLLAIAVLLVAAIGGGAWWFLGGRDGGLAGDGPDMGEATYKAPDAASVITSKQWGTVPANQIGIVLAEGGKRRDAEKVAKKLNGSLVGEMEFIDLYQIEYPGTTEDDLTKAIATAKANDKVALAFPNEETFEDAEIWGVRQEPYQEPMYEGEAGDGYRAIGVPQAWKFVRGAGLDLETVRVGVIDSGLWAPGEGRESEFGGEVEVDSPDEDGGKASAPSVNDDGSTNPAGTHGTGVMTVIGADPGNGGPAGVAGPLGKKLKITSINRSSPKYATTTSTPDPNDPTKVTLSGGTTWALGDLKAVQTAVANNAKVINCSFGKTNGNPEVAAAYKKFFEKMAQDHPGVLFVCSAGNDHQVVDGSRRYPSGHAFDNMITVGGMNNDGNYSSYSNGKSENYEITLAAPGTKAIVGMGPDGEPVRQNGTSFATPHVTAAAAILLSLNPSLKAADIKRILSETARKGLTIGDPGDPKAHSNLIPDAYGGRVLAVDLAVLQVINDMRAEKGLGKLTPEILEQIAVVDAVAVTGEPGEYAVKGIVKMTGDKGTDLAIDVSAENHAIGGKSSQPVAANTAGEVKWTVTLPKDEGVITVRRTDNDAASIITVEKFDINGSWSGVFTITEFTITDQKAAEEEGCSAAILSALKGKKIPMTMDITVDESGQGSGTGLIDVGSLDPDDDVTSNPTQYGISYSGSTITYEPQSGEGVSSMKATVSRQGENLVQKGTLTGGGKGWRLKAVFTLSKPDTPK
ncbi:MAG: S8 family serine peptidase [Coriobacteriia bacterium]|nr:S8 family serine peptidase [Coriobacteriia bacterium]